MDTGMLIILATGAAFGGWAALAVMGEERSRRLRQMEAQRPVIPTAAVSMTSSVSAAKAQAPRKRDGTTDAAAKNAR
jgi:hypothetical protein